MAFVTQIDVVLAEEKPHPCATLSEDLERLACYDSQKNGKASEAVSEDESEVSELEQRVERDSLFKENRFVLIPHKPTYILPYTFVTYPNEKPYLENSNDITADDEDLKHSEAKFQLSIKVPLYSDFPLDNSTLWFGYTQRSLWQVYNSSASSPFRETNYEPEFFWSLNIDSKPLGIPLEQFQLGFTHQSNGRGGALSRSWNRIYTSFTLARGRWAFTLKPWYRIPESDEDDDNPDIDDYLGYGDFIAVYKWKEMTASTKLRNNFHFSDSRTSFELNFSFPLAGRFKGYVEYINGYGETLIDYNHRNQRIGIGFILNDWF